MLGYKEWENERKMMRKGNIEKIFNRTPPVIEAIVIVSSIILSYFPFFQNSPISLVIASANEGMLIGIWLAEKRD